MSRQPSYNADQGDNTGALRHRIAALEAENAELRKDAERYRWLSKQFRAMSLDMGGNHCWVQRSSGAIRGPSVDEAVDAALKETP